MSFRGTEYSVKIDKKKSVENLARTLHVQSALLSVTAKVIVHGEDNKHSTCIVDKMCPIS